MPKVSRPRELGTKAIAVTGPLPSTDIGPNRARRPSTTYPSFPTSVGSRTLKLWQAVIIAGIFEFAGAVGLGSETPKTVASDISNTAYYMDVSEMYMYGMLCSLAVAGTWLFLATFMKLPVSITHSIIGAIMGFSLVYGGWNGVLLIEELDNFPFYKGFLPGVLSWFFSPIIGGILAPILFSLSKFIILQMLYWLKPVVGVKELQALGDSEEAVQQAAQLLASQYKAALAGGKLAWAELCESKVPSWGMNLHAGYQGEEEESGGAASSSVVSIADGVGRRQHAIVRGLVNVKNHMHQTPLVMAARHNQPECISYLLEMV
eukprot:gene15701-21810_t